MKRKFFSTLLFGALACTTLSTVTSCKDYDDDIKNLQTQIDQKAALTKITDLETQVAAAKSAAEQAYTEAKAKATPDQVTAAQTAAEKKAKELADAAEKSAKDAAAAALIAYSAEVNDTLANYMLTDDILEALGELKADYEDADAKQQEQIDALNKKVTNWGAAIDQLYSAVTEVSLVGSYTDGKFIQLSTSYEVGNATSTTTVKGNPFDISFVTGKTGSEDVVFGKNQKDPTYNDNTKKYAKDANSTYTYAKDTEINFPKSIVVRINPVNATVLPSMIKLVDSEGNSLDKVVKVESVKKFNELLTRGTENTGLWTVELGIADGCKTSEVEQTKGDKHILYAMTVNNTAYDSTRYVASTYDITLQKTTEYTKCQSLEGIQLKSETQSPNYVALSEFSCREKHPDVTRTLETAGSATLKAANGEKIYVKFDTKKVNSANIDRFYIVRDDNFAETTSKPSELNAWDSYKYSSSLGDIVEVKNGTGVADFTVTIPSNLATGDIVAFRIFAVNYDGTLVDADGEGFEVTIVNAQNQASVSGDIVATSTIGSASAWLPIENASNLTTSETLPSHVYMDYADGTALNAIISVQYAKDAEGKQTTSVAKEAKYAKFTWSDANGSIAQWKDNSTLVGNIKTTGDNSETVTNIKVSLTKKLPGAAEAKELYKSLKWKDNQKVNGVFTAYLMDTGNGLSWDGGLTSSELAYTDLGGALTGFKGSNFVYVVKNAVAENEGNSWAYTGDLEVSGSGSDNGILALSLADESKINSGDIAQILDNKTQHDTEIRYNFGVVSSESKKSVYGVADEFKTIFACPLATTAQLYSWKQIPAETKDGKEVTPAKNVNYMTYGSKTQDYDLAEYLIGHNSFDNSIFGGSFSKCALLYSEGGKHVEAKVISNTSKEEDYFTVTFDYATKKFVFNPLFTNLNPTSDVESTFVLTLTDQFGHKNVYELPFTVKRVEQ